MRASARTGRLVTSATLILGLRVHPANGVEHRARKPLISSAAVVNAAARARLELEVAGRARHGAGGGVDGEGEPEAGLVLE